MQAPVLFLDTVVIPGTGGDIEIPAPVERQLAQVWDLDGFGCVDVVLAAPADPAEPCTRDNFAAIGTLAEVCIGPEGPEGGTSVVTLSESHRVAIVKLVDTPTAYSGAWTGVFAEVVPSAPKSGGVTKSELEGLERLVGRWLLSESCDRDVEDVVDALSKLAHPGIAPWRTVYLVGDLVLGENAERVALLTEDDLSVAARSLHGSLSVEPLSDRETVEQLAVFMDYSVEEGLERAVKLLDATSVVARHCQPEGHVVPTADFARLRADIINLCQRAHAMVDEVNDVAVAIRTAEKSKP